MLRVTQEMLYDTVGPSIERQLPDLIARARALRGKQGDLADPRPRPGDAPRYLSAAVDIHTKPGSYQQELTADDVFAGAEFDRTYRLYSMGINGPNLDAAGWSLIAWIKKPYPDLRPRTRILDMGCTVGHSTLALRARVRRRRRSPRDRRRRALPALWPCPGGRHGRRQVHFSQQNAERTDLRRRARSTLVVSHLLMHETSRMALRNVFAEIPSPARAGRRDGARRRRAARRSVHKVLFGVDGALQQRAVPGQHPGRGFHGDLCRRRA